jgi:hypothetical protein
VDVVRRSRNVTTSHAAATSRRDHQHIAFPIGANCLPRPAIRRWRPPFISLTPLSDSDHFHVHRAAEVDGFGAPSTLAQRIRQPQLEAGVCPKNAILAHKLHARKFIGGSPATNSLTAVVDLLEGADLLQHRSS